MSICRTVKSVLCVSSGSKYPRRRHKALFPECRLEAMSRGAGLKVGLQMCYPDRVLRWIRWNRPNPSSPIKESAVI